jgi:hypothetical protein
MRRSQSDINQAILDGPRDQGSYAGAAARGTVVAFSGQITRMVLQIGGTAVMSRLLTPGDFGLVAMAATVTAFVGIFTDMGLSGATIQKKKNIARFGQYIVLAEPRRWRGVAGRYTVTVAACRHFL